MKKIICIMLALLSLLLIGCSSVDNNEMVAFCEERNMSFDQEFTGRFECSITDKEYLNLKIENLLAEYRQACLYIIEGMNKTPCNITENG